MNLSGFIPVKNFERLYLIHPDGRFWSKSYKRLNKPSMNPGGYLQIHMFTGSKIKTTTLHRVLAFHFIPNPDNKPQINHKDGNKLNNALNNLEWCTSQENVQHSHDIGLAKGRKGLKHHNVCLTEQDVREIKYIWKHKLCISKILAEIYGIDAATIRRIGRNERWKHITI